MRRIIVKEARPGMCAARGLTCLTPEGVPAVVVQTGETLTLDLLIRIHEMGVYDFWVNDPGLDFFDRLCAQPTAAQTRLAEGLRDSFLRLGCWAPQSLFKRYGLVLDETLNALVRAAAAVPCLAAFTEDEALLSHSCDVAAVSLLLGLQLEGYLVEQRRRLNCKHARDVVNLALGALFHDIGELVMPPDQRESRRTNFDSDAWQQHVAEGFAMVRGRIDPSAAGIVLHHHQHFDGTGFAGPAAPASGAPGPAHRVLQGSSIHVLARIVMAADTFCQCLFAGARLPQPMIKALWQIQQMPQRKAFDPIIHQCLMATFQPFVEGMVVTLNDHRQAVVTRVDAAFPCFPEVRVLQNGERTSDFGALDGAVEPAPGVVFNLAERGDLRIEVIDGAEVEPYVYGVRKAAPLAAA